MGWKILFWFVAVSLTILLAVSAFDVTWNLVDWLSFLALYITIAALWGYAYKKRLGPRRVWRTGIILAIVYWLVYAFWLDPRFGAYPTESFGDSLFTALIPFPIFLGAIRYAWPTAVRSSR